MKEATGEGSMTIVTIVIIVALGLAAAVIVGFFITQAGTKANGATKVNVDQQNTINKDNLFNNNNNNNNNNNG